MSVRNMLMTGLILACAGIAHAADVLKVQEVQVAPGGSAALNIELENKTTNLMGWQCDIVLPEGLALALKNNGKPIAVLGERFATTEHSISSVRLSNGAYRFIATSMDGEAIPGNSGTLFTVTLVADASLAEQAGTGPAPTLTGRVVNIEFNTQDNQRLLFNDVPFTVSTGKKGDANGDGTVDIADVTAIINRINGIVSTNFNEAAADVNGDGQIDIADVTGVINIINQ